ncbi:MAG TPA: hypothetical protein VMZ53_11985 [Kofleriaceae bacterium]|nr:hypothetical protein [Kofleriaceae bacterium]
MAPRALGALFALVAAIAFAASIATSAWWSGPPTVDGDLREVQNVHVGLLGGEGCNPGGEGGCETVEVSDTLRLMSYGVLGVHALATLFALLLAISAARVGDSRKGLATTSLIMTLLAAGGAAAMLVLGPAIQAGSSVVEVPFGYGLYILGGAILSSFIATLLVRRIEPEPLRLKPGLAPTAQHAPPDIRDILRSDHEGVRPSAPNLFDGAPQLRPLYDAEGVPPAPTAPNVPTRAPTPLPQRQIDVLTGKATPPPLARPAPDAFAQTMPAPAIMQPPPPRAKPVTSPPRTKPPSAAPPAAKVDLAGPTLNAPKQPRAKTLPAGSDPGIKRPTQPPPSPAASQPMLRSSAPTLAHSVPPMPTLDNQPPPAVLPAGQRATTETDDSLETGMRPTENITAVEIDHEAKAKAQHARITGQRPAPSTKPPAIKSPPIKPLVPAPAKGAKPVPPQRHDTEVATGDEAALGDVTETGMEAAPPRPGNIITGEQRSLSTVQREVARAPTDDPFDAREVTMPPRSHHDPVHAPISETFPVARISELVPASIVPDEGADDGPEDLMATMQRDKTPIPTLNSREQNRMPSETPAPGTQLPSPRSMSTAPSSLPPPKNLTVDTVPSGPTPACPQCESPMAWVEEHLRFYCKSCRMYF